MELNLRFQGELLKCPYPTLAIDLGFVLLCFAYSHTPFPDSATKYRTRDWTNICFGEKVFRVWKRCLDVMGAGLLLRHRPHPEGSTAFLTSQHKAGKCHVLRARSPSTARLWPQNTSPQEDQLSLLTGRLPDPPSWESTADAFYIMSNYSKECHHFYD